MREVFFCKEIPLELQVKRFVKLKCIPSEGQEESHRLGRKNGITLVQLYSKRKSPLLTLHFNIHVLCEAVHLVFFLTRK